MESRSLRYTGEKSDKFWTISLEALSHTVNYGRAGTAGQTKEKTFESEAAARKSFEKLLQAKLKKGYVDVQVPASPAVALETPAETPSETPSKTPSEATVEASTEPSPPVAIQSSAVGAAPAARSQDLLTELKLQLKPDQKRLIELAVLDAIAEPFWALLDVKVRTAIAKQSFLPSAVWKRLAADAHETVRQTVASNLFAPPALLAKLAEDGTQAVRLAIAKNNSTATGVLASFETDPYKNIQKAAAKTQERHQINLSCIRRKQEFEFHPSPIESLLEIDQDTVFDNNYRDSVNWYVLSDKAVAQQGPERLRDSAKSDNDRIRIAVASNPKTPADCLQALATDEHQNSSTGGGGGTCYITRYFVQESVALNPNTPPETLWQLLKKEHLLINICLANNPNTPEEILHHLVASYKPEVPIRDGHKFVSHGDVATKKRDAIKLKERLYLSLAHNPATSLRTLSQLAKIKIASSKETPTSAVMHEGRPVWSQFTPAEMAKYRYRRHHRLEAQQSTPTADTIQALLVETDPTVRATLGLTEAGLAALLHSGLKSKQSLSRLMAIAHPAQPSATLVDLAQSKQWWDRYGVTQNPSTAEALLQQLSEDGDPFVQGPAKLKLGLEAPPAPEKPSGEVAVEPELAVPLSEAAYEVPEQLEIERSLHISTEDWQWVTWKDQAPLPLESEVPFSLEACEKRSFQAESNGWDWDKAKLSISMSEQEARFWLAKMLGGHQLPPLGINSQQQTLEKVMEQAYRLSLIQPSTERKQLTCYLATPLHRAFGISQVVQTVTEMAAWPDAEVFAFCREPLHDLTSYNDYVLRGVYDPTYQYYGSQHAHGKVKGEFMRWAVGLMKLIVEGFRQSIYPYLSVDETASIRQQLEPLFHQSFPQPLQESLFHLAAFIGLHDVVRREVETWEKTNFYSHNYHTTWAREERPSLVLRLTSPELVEQHMRRINFVPRAPLEFTLCLATTGFKTLDLLCKRFAGSSRFYGSEASFKHWLKLATAPEMAPYMLELTLNSKVSKQASQWLDDNLICAVVGLIPVAAGEGPKVAIVKKADLVDAAQRFLLGQVRQGNRGLIEAALKDCSDGIAAKIQTTIFEHPELSRLPFTAATTPPWLSQAMAELPMLDVEVDVSTTGFNASELPQIIVAQYCLTHAQGQRVLQALELSPLSSPLSLLTELKQHATAESLDAFVWSLFERWMAEGADNKQKWAMQALGLLGSDEVALKLTPMIRWWPGKSQHHKARLGLECLRAMGTDTALMQINGIAQKIKYKGLKGRAQECMADIARDRQFTPEQLEDRIIPDCGLDAQGQRSFDFGPRQFKFALGPDLKPFVRDEKGKLRASLPKPNQKDDAELAKQAIADWKLMKKQISAVVKLQAIRLEQAMVNERRWPLTDFHKLLVQHPLMTHLVQRLIWGCYDGEGQLVQTFRIAEDQTFADENDDTIANLSGGSLAEDKAPAKSEVTIGVIHPLFLDANATALWGETLSDYEIIPPFPQLSRDIYRLTPEEQEATELKRFVSSQVPGVALARMMDNYGWLKGALHDHGDYRVHYKYFKQADLTAIVGNYEHQHTQQSSIYGDDAISSCLFLPGHHPEPYEYPAPDSWYGKRLETKPIKHLKLIDPLVMSEVLRDLTAIANAGKG